jgi:hypothetical protein
MKAVDCHWQQLYFTSFFPFSNLLDKYLSCYHFGLHFTDVHVFVGAKYLFHCWPFPLDSTLSMVNFAGRHRWVEYAEKGRYNASQVPPEWHGWLHHITDSTGDKASFPTC